MVGGAIARPTATPACPDGLCQGTGHEIFTSSGSSVKQALVMSTSSDGLHHGSPQRGCYDRAVKPDWRACCHCGCHSGDELRGGLLT
jgi:hypothetical protein